MNIKSATTGVLATIFGITLMALSGMSVAGHCDNPSSHGSSDDGIDWHAIMYLDQ